jgi:hypothetical protein
MLVEEGRLVVAEGRLVVAEGRLVVVHVGRLVVVHVGRLVVVGRSVEGILVEGRLVAVWLAIAD